MYIRYCLDGSLFDLRRLTAKTRTLHKLIREAPFSPMSVPSCHTKTVIYSQCLTVSPRHPGCLGRHSVSGRSRYCISLHPTPTQLTKPCCRRYPAQECRHAVVGKRLQSLRAVEMMIHAVQTNTFRMPTMWKK